MDNVSIRDRRGSLHFIRFPSNEMENFLSLAKSKGMAELVTTVCATGGGAFMYEQSFKKVRIPIYRQILEFKICCFFSHRKLICGWPNSMNWTH